MDDLRTRPLATFDFRAPGRDPVADAEEVHTRLASVLAALPDEAWARELTASDVSGAPAWTLRDHIGHVADWDDEAVRYASEVVAGSGGWPTDDDYGDMDAWNESRRGRWAGRTPAEMRAWYDAASTALVDVARRLPRDMAASDEAWVWLFSLLSEHAIEHVQVLGEDATAGA